MKKLVICLITLAGCQSSNDKKSIEQMQDQVMVVHDEIMPRTDDLMDLKEKISHQIDSLSKITPASASVKARQEEGLTINKDLTETDSLMFAWMNHYNADTVKGMDETQAKAYLDLELKKISEVKAKINSGITQAKKFLGN
ncbi:hypothetical protein [Larkinella punicea]|uniref:Viral A-type inclusion protein n=1 Tax=Larkinella punicea TaxID=2315727 RepID=A0A368JPE6_9BACT|nr:hypothetical protein [Larkinella punicea]RCR69540.1 hypothetical protein DUE52_11895 [Larkinella punicea]